MKLLSLMKYTVAALKILWEYPTKQTERRSELTGDSSKGHTARFCSTRLFGSPERETGRHDLFIACL